MFYFMTILGITLRLNQIKLAQHKPTFVTESALESGNFVFLNWLKSVSVVNNVDH